VAKNEIFKNGLEAVLKRAGWFENRSAFIFCDAA
jgi:hypothetical protein